MKIKFTDNVTESLLDVLKPQLSEAKEIKFGVAFAKYSGFLLSDLRKEKKLCQNQSR